MKKGQFRRKTHCVNGHLLTGETPEERACAKCRNMRWRRHRVNDTASADKRRASQRAYRERQAKPPRRERFKLPPRPKLDVCRRGHDRTDPTNLTKRRNCKACNRITAKFRWAGEPLPEARA